MSYTQVIPATDKAQLAAALTAGRVTHEDDASLESDEHLAAALDAAAIMAKVVGRPGDPVVVEVSGHANPGHAPQEGVSDEVLHLTVRCIPAVVAVNRAEDATPI